MIFAIYFLVTTLWLIIAGLGCAAMRYYQDKLGRVVEVKTPVQAAVIMPVRGVPDSLEAMWAALSRQTYPSWRLILAVESEDDPAYAVLNRLLSSGQSFVPTTIVVAGAATDSGQKVHNQRAAAATLSSADEAIVFADADIIPTPDWLTRLVVGLDNRAVAMVSGYRWLVPVTNNLATLVVCAANNAIATLPRLRRWNHAWGGSMAVRRETLEQMNLLAQMRGSLSDDLSLTRAVHAAGGVIIGPRELLVPTPVSYGWRDGADFARRQYRIVRLYTPRLWIFGAVVMTISLLGWVLAIGRALTGSPLAIGQLVAVLAFEQVRSHYRGRVVETLWGSEGLASMRGVLRLQRWGGPFNMAWHACVIWSTVLGRTVRWAGRVYRVVSPRELTIVTEPSKRPR